MTRLTTVNGHEAVLTLKGASLTYERTTGEQTTGDISITPTTPGTYSILFNNRVYRVTRAPNNEVLINGRIYQAEASDPRDARRQSNSAAAHGPQHITAPMPGKVVRVLVSPGNQVDQGQGLVVVEAMKMQNEMKSPKSGRVLEVKAKPDATVAAGEVLVIVE
jgi:biotin carboxyl carrier protein